MCVLESVGFCKRSGPLAFAGIAEKRTRTEQEMSKRSFFNRHRRGEIDVPGKRKVSSYSRQEQGIGMQRGLHPAERPTNVLRFDAFLISSSLTRQSKYPTRFAA